MGKQLNKVIKRRRLKAYKDRKKALVKSGAARKVASKSEPKAAKKAAAKKPAVKKAKPVAAAD
jgi:hypothetical protein